MFKTVIGLVVVIGTLAAPAWAQQYAGAAYDAAEKSPDNVCSAQENAGRMISQLSSIFANNKAPLESPIVVVDVSSIVTIQNVGLKVACHGVFLLGDGSSLEGTVTDRPGAGGNTVTIWTPGPWQPPAAPPVAASGAAPGTAHPIAFELGLADRRLWESWFGGLTGDTQRGAEYWASQRSLPKPGSCELLPGDAATGCREAKAKLTTGDMLRKFDPDYRSGWNSYTPPNVQQATN